jgi:hypothetical protein
MQQQLRHLQELMGIEHDENVFQIFVELMELALHAFIAMKLRICCII